MASELEDRLTEVPRCLDSIAFNGLGHIALVGSYFTGRKWNGAFLVYHDPKFAPHAPHHDYGSVCEAGCTDVSWITDHRLAVSTDAGSVEIWDLKEASSLEVGIVLAEHSDICSSISVSDDKFQLVSGCWDGIIKIWDLAVDISIHSIRMHTDKVLDVCFCCRSSNVFGSASEDGTIKIYDSREEKPAFLLGDNSSYFACSLSWKNDNCVAAGLSNGEIQLYDTRSPCEVLSSSQMHSKSVNQLVFNPGNSSLLASCSNDCTVKLIDSSSWTPMYTYDKHSDYVKGLAINPVDNSLWSCGFDGKVVNHSDAIKQLGREGFMEA